MKISYKAFDSLNQLLRLQTGLTFKVSRQTLYNYRLYGVPPERLAALSFCLLANNVSEFAIMRTLETAECSQALEYTLNQLLEIPS